MKSGWNIVLTFTLLIAVGLGCKSGATTSTNTPDKPAELASSSPPAAPPDIAGSYNVVGTNPNGSPYKGALEVIKHGDVYQFRWTAGQQYDGVGVVNGNIVAVAFANGADGKGCGVVDYAIAADGTLAGKWGYWDVDESGTENARRTSGSGLVGAYDANGSNPDGKPYKGTMSVAAEGHGYKFVWSNGAEGFGVKQGSNVAVGIGGARCAFVSYQIKPDGTLDGIWGGYGTSSTGTEKATKK
jgi:hypothetical protein